MTGTWLINHFIWIVVELSFGYIRYNGYRLIFAYNRAILKTVNTSTSFLKEQ